jgi:predicted site-specific integrase-resolvase
MYARVSSHEQKKKGDLDRQIKTAQQHCKTKELGDPQVFQDVSSGLNTNRPGLKRLCRAIEQQTINRIIVTYPDRLTRFGFSYLANYWQSHGATIEVMNQPLGRSMEDELVQDMIAIITSFSGRVHGLRSAQTRRQKKTDGRRGNKTAAPEMVHKRKKDPERG